MQYMVYKNPGKHSAFPFVIDVTSDIIGDINRRLVIPLMSVERFKDKRSVERLNPVLSLLDEKSYILMTHEMATIPVKALGSEFCDASSYRVAIKDALDFMIDGF